MYQIPKISYAEFKKLWDKAVKETGISWVRSDIAFAQAYHETANFSSSIFIENNNFFGLKHPNSRKLTTSNGVNRGHANYSTQLDSIKDYLYYFEQWDKTRQDRFFLNVSDSTKYIQTFKTVGYAEDTEYLRKLENIFEHFKRLNFFNMDIKEGLKKSFSKEGALITIIVMSIGVGLVYAIKWLMNRKKVK